MGVLREYKSIGTFSKILLAVITLDTALSLVVFASLFTLTGNYLEGSGSLSPMQIIFRPLFEIAMAIALGAAAGWLLEQLARRLPAPNDTFMLSFGVFIACAGLSSSFNLNPILIGVAAGTTIVNFGKDYQKIFNTFYNIEAPMIALFFILAGSRLQLLSLLSTGLFGLVYFALRIMGKTYGSGLGAEATDANTMVRKYLGLSLVPQAGIAAGLILLIQTDMRFAHIEPFITTVGITAILVNEVVGPVLTKIAVSRAEEDAKRTVLFNQSH
jgi:Kef-type K+ transport system membrane component KefB